MEEPITHIDLIHQDRNYRLSNIEELKFNVGNGVKSESVLNMHLTEVSLELRRLSKCFYSTGNEMMCAKLELYSEVVKACASKIGLYSSSLLSQGLEHQKEMSANLLKAFIGNEENRLAVVPVDE